MGRELSNGALCELLHHNPAHLYMGQHRILVPLPPGLWCHKPEVLNNSIHGLHWTVGPSPFILVGDTFRCDGNTCPLLQLRRNPDPVFPDVPQQDSVEKVPGEGWRSGSSKAVVVTTSDIITAEDGRYLGSSWRQGYANNKGDRARDSGIAFSVDFTFCTAYRILSAERWQLNWLEPGDWWIPAFYDVCMGAVPVQMIDKITDCLDRSYGGQENTCCKVIV